MSKRIMYTTTVHTSLQGFFFPKDKVCETKIWTNLLKLCSAAAAKSLQSCPTLCDPTEARILEWVAISFFNTCVHVKALQSCPTL